MPGLGQSTVSALQLILRYYFLYKTQRGPNFGGRALVAFAGTHGDTARAAGGTAAVATSARAHHGPGMVRTQEPAAEVPTATSTANFQEGLRSSSLFLKVDIIVKTGCSEGSSRS